MSIFSLFILLLLGVAIVGAFRRPRELEAPEVIDEPVSEPLPEHLVEPVGETCVDITRRGIELLEVLTDAERMLGRADGTGAIDAAARFSEVEPLVSLIADAAQELIDGHKRLPDEVSWWLSFVLEKVERLGLVDEGERVSAGTGGPAARGAVNAALTEVQALLLACHEVAQRMLDFDLPGWVKAELGREQARAYARAVEAALRRSE